MKPREWLVVSERLLAHNDGPMLLATILFEKVGQHQPLNRQAERHAREGVALGLSPLADLIEGHRMRSFG